MSPPRRFAHRGLPARWQNTLHGVRTALELGYHGVEVDVVVTKDGVAVLSHDPWLHPTHVVHTDGRAVCRDTPLIRHQTLAQLQSRYRFGAPGPQDTDTTPATESVPTLAQVVALCNRFPAAGLYLDLKIERPKKRLTRSARVYARAVFGALAQAHPDLDLWVECGSKAILQRMTEAADRPMHCVASFPRFDAGVNDTAEAVLMGLGSWLGTNHPGRTARRMGARHYVAPQQIISRSRAQEAADMGVRGVFFGVDSADEARDLADWPVDVLIVDHTPELCPA